jgi:Ca2+-binding EF-hand superfamily protein
MIWVMTVNKKAVILLLFVAFFFVKPAFAVFGDVNGDGKVDMADVAIVAKAFGANPSDPRWNSQADLDGDLKISVKDIALVCVNFGKSD